MNWILLAVGAQFLNAIVALIDKRIVSDEHSFPKPFVYAFYTCLISGAWIIVYLFGFIPFVSSTFHIPTMAHVEQPTLQVVALSFLAAYAFFTALTSMFSALKAHDASDVVPVIGSVTALASFGLSYFFLGTKLSPTFMLGVALLSIGTFFVSRLRFPLRTALMAIYSGIFFALHYISIKGLFQVTTFDNGFFWSRVAFVFFALTLLMIPNYWERVRVQTKTTGWSGKLLILVNKLLAGIATLLILRATDIGDVTVVQALGGIQFVFILILGIFFTIKAPANIPKVETYHPDVILQKAIFVAIITLGFLVLFK